MAPAPRSFDLRVPGSIAFAPEVARLLDHFQYGQRVIRFPKESHGMAKGTNGHAGQEVET